jgi:hypothetical protein
MTSCLSCDTASLNGSTVCYSGAPTAECSPLLVIDEPTKQTNHTNGISLSYGMVRRNLVIISIMTIIMMMVRFD